MTTPGAARSIAPFVFGASDRAGHDLRHALDICGRPGVAASKVSSMTVRSVRVHPNKRLKLTAHAGVFDLSPVRCSLSAIR